MRFFISVLIISIVALIVRSYTVPANMPFFYDEDEAHHFNRVANMAKSGDMNPHYFHKPSLHFYLRIPVVYAATEWSKIKGYLNSVQEIRTHNQYGLARYNFTASHPGIVKWNRGLSLLMGVLCILFTCLIAKELFNSSAIAVCAGIFSLLSPPLITYSGIIGVDILMTLMCLISAYFSLQLFNKFSFTKLTLAAIFAGLATSSKYNALPICALPFCVCYLTGRLNSKAVAISLIVPILAFFIASPYILISMPVFIEDLSYEIWHYSVAGHEGHSANRGLDQVIFYTHWFWNEALGMCITFLAGCGIIALILAGQKKYLGFLIFPLLFFALMIMQKTNFTRNMLVILPFLAIAAAYLINLTLNNLNINKKIKYFLLTCVTAVVSYQPAMLAYSDYQNVINHKDSRRELESWLMENNSSSPLAVSGQLQLTRAVHTLKNVSVVDTKLKSSIALFQDGYERIVVGKTDDGINFSQYPYLNMVKQFPGQVSRQRIVDNPFIQVFDFVNGPDLLRAAIQNISECNDCYLRLSFTDNKTLKCEIPRESGATDSALEDHCWAQSKVTRIFLDTPENLKKNIKTGATVRVKMTAMSPWQKQKISLINEKGEVLQTIMQDKPAGSWQEIEFSAEKADLIGSGSLLIYSESVLSPKKMGLNPDERRLAVAIRELKIE